MAKRKIHVVSRIFGFLTLFVLAGILTFGILYGVNKALFTNPPDSYEEETSTLPEPEAPEPEEQPEEVVLEPDFQSVIDEWVKTVGGNKSILIYDLDLDKKVAEYNIKENYNTASLYKLFVVYEGYKRVEEGT